MNELYFSDKLLTDHWVFFFRRTAKVHILSLPTTRYVSVVMKTSLPSHCGTYKHDFG